MLIVITKQEKEGHMFTGIIESVGKVKAMQPVGGDIRLVIESDDLDFSDVSLGDSIASNGICLTVVDLGSNYYAVDVSRETIARTALEDLKSGHVVNLEKPCYRPPALVGTLSLDTLMGSAS